jgi:integrase/recombinase XerD
MKTRSILTAEKICTFKEAAKLLRTAREKIDALKGTKDPLLIRFLLDYFLIGIGYYTGLRISEISKLDWSDINLEETFLIVREGKGGKTRTVHFGKKVSEMFQELQELQGEFCPWSEVSVKRGRAVFVSPKNKKRILRGGIHLRFKEMVRLAGLRDTLTYHSLRHGNATYLINSGVPLHVVQQQLGHSSLNITQIYLHFTEDNKNLLLKVS